MLYHYYCIPNSHAIKTDEFCKLCPWQCVKWLDIRALFDILPLTSHQKQAGQVLSPFFWVCWHHCGSQVETVFHCVAMPIFLCRGLWCSTPHERGSSQRRCGCSFGYGERTYIYCPHLLIHNLDFVYYFCGRYRAGYVFLVLRHHKPLIWH